MTTVAVMTTLAMTRAMATATETCAAFPSSRSSHSSPAQTTIARFLVRFDEYASVSAHESETTRALESNANANVWRVVSRAKTSASRAPTDFVVVERVGASRMGRTTKAFGRDDELETLRATLRGVAKDVHREQRFTNRRAMLSATMTEDDANGDLGENDDDDSDDANGGGRGRRRLRVSGESIASKLGAQEVWSRGHTGAGVKMAIFDTGIAEKHPHFRHIAERTNWTNEDQLEDGLGHGSFVAGVIAGTGKECLGIAPDAEIHTFRVFTNDQNSYTSWFLDGFNYAIASGVHVLNLSIGGPDYLDVPFVDKVHEIVAAGIIMISAIGNDGPLYGTLNNPADNLDVIGIGGITDSDQIAQFSSRGMSTWELPSGYGRVKPDLVTYGDGVWGSKIGRGCRSLSGTSVASPVAAGAAVLLSSILPEGERRTVLNPAVMKQVLVEGATRLPNAHRYEQGAGKLNLRKSAEILRDYVPRASTVPSEFDLTECPYAWPHCKQGAYATMMPIILNATIVNGLGLHGEVVVAPRFTPSDDAGDLGEHLDVRFAFSETLWPYSGFLATYVRVKNEASAMRGVASGVVRFTVASPPAIGERETRVSEVEMTIRLNVVPTPERAKRLLWDQFHNVRYPPGYIPRDNIEMKQDVLDWHGDHPHTNFHQWYDALTDAGYFVEVLGSPFTCFDAKNYGALLLVDLEEEYSEEEIAKLERDVREEGLGLFVAAEWYSVSQMKSMKFLDDNTHYEWEAATGGANVPALNDLLKNFGVQFGGDVVEGSVELGDDRVVVSSGSHVARAPAGAYLHSSDELKFRDGVNRGKSSAFLALVRANRGRVFAYVDSNCLDSSHSKGLCFGFARKGVEFAVGGACDSAHCDDAKRLDDEWSDGQPLPERRDDVDFSQFSTVLGGHPGNEGSMKCGANAPLEFHEAKASYTELPGRLKPPSTLARRDVDAVEKNDVASPVASPVANVESRTTLDARTPVVVVTRDVDSDSISPSRASSARAFLLLVVAASLCVLVARARRKRARRRAARPAAAAAAAADR